MTFSFNTNLLLVPMKVDALVLRQDRMAVEAFADFSGLPYSDGRYDYNSNNANISENILASPFQNLGLQLKKGTHLHFKLPVALTKNYTNIIQNNSIAGNNHIKTPNRWVINRLDGGDITAQFVVESNYLHPASNIPGSGYVTIPNPDTGMPQRFRYLGRQLTLDEWTNDKQQNEYWEDLTALGYGEPAFAGFYPNCHGIFGFFDDQLPGTDVVKYEVIGWYSDLNDDPIAQLVAGNNSPSPEDLQQFILSTFDWKYDSNKNEIPQQLVCYGSISIQETNTSFPDDVEVMISDSPLNATISNLSQRLTRNQTDEDEGNASADFLKEQLNAIASSARHDPGGVDFVYKISEATRDTGFASLRGNTCWEVNSDLFHTSKENAQEIPASISGQLHMVNHIQWELDQLNDQLIGCQEQLFSDWYKYMICSYPPLGETNDYPNPDEVKYFIENEINQTLAAINEKISNRRLAFSTSAEQLLDLIQKYYNPPEGVPLIKATSGARYYQPINPVLMITGFQSSDTDLTGSLPCQFQKIAAGTIMEQLNELIQGVGNAGDDFRSASASVSGRSKPLFIEWQVNFAQAAEGSNLQTNNRKYEDDYLTRNYQSSPDAMDMQPHDGIEYFTGQNIYSGRSYLNTTAGKNAVSERLAQYIKSYVLPEYQKENGKTMDLSDRETPATLLAWLQSKNIRNHHMAATALQAYQALQDINPVSQILSGFNDLLLMHRLTLQLDVADPNGFADDQDFAGLVQKAIDGQIRNAPEPMVDFNPFRGGELTLNQLNIIDNFGFGYQADVSNLEPVKLPPRFSQPCQLMCNWLDANNDAIQFTEIPLTSPICGWLLPNNLDESLMVYDATGKSLGSITIIGDQRWRPNPGDANPVSVSQIQNTYLQNVVQYVIGQGPQYLKDLRSALNSGLENSQPENFRQHVSRALLMGRPIAVTRITASIRVKGNPATDQSWDAFRNTLRYGTRDTHGFENVRVQLNIGAFEQLNDGVLGFWKDLEGDESDQTFYAVQSSVSSESPHIIPHDQMNNPLMPTLSSDPMTLTVLMDPGGKLHAFCPLLPTKILEIPSYMYAGALQSIEIGFLTAPILTGDTIALPLPDESGYGWSFNQLLSDGTWHRWAKQGIVTLTQVTARFQNGNQLWSELLAAGWIVPDANMAADTARIVPGDQRNPPEGGSALAVGKVAMESWLDDLILATADDRARFTPNIRIREGWLKLTPNIAIAKDTKNS